MPSACNPTVLNPSTWQPPGKGFGMWQPLRALVSNLDDVMSVVASDLPDLPLRRVWDCRAPGAQTWCQLQTLVPSDSYSSDPSAPETDSEEA